MVDSTPERVLRNAGRLSRRRILQSVLATSGIAGIVSLRAAVAQTASPGGALALAQILNQTRYSDLPPTTIKHAKIILASTLASAAAGSQIGSAGIVRELAKEQGGKPEATIWFDGAKLPVNEAARVNAMLSDAAASDDSDLRNVAHTGTCLTATGLAMAERMGATGQDLLSAMVTGLRSRGPDGRSARADRRGRQRQLGTGFPRFHHRRLRRSGHRVPSSCGLPTSRWDKRSP